MAAVTFSKGDLWREGSERKEKREEKRERTWNVEGNSHTGGTTNNITLQIGERGIKMIISMM